MKTIDDSNHHRPPVRMGIAWYRKEQWQRLRQSSEDVDELLAWCNIQGLRNVSMKMRHRLREFSVANSRFP